MSVYQQLVLAFLIWTPYSSQFLKEQAALSATEITADTVKEFTAESEEESEVEEIVNYSKGAKHTWGNILKNIVQMSSSKTSGEDIFQFNKRGIQIAKVNGTHNKHMQHVSLRANEEVLSQGNGVAKMILANIPIYREVLPGLECWRASKVASWCNLQGHSVQWFCIVCIDRRGNVSYCYATFRSSACLAKLKMFSRK